MWYWQSVLLLIWCFLSLVAAFQPLSFSNMSYVAAHPVNGFSSVACCQSPYTVPIISIHTVKPRFNQAYLVKCVWISTVIFYSFVREIIDLICCSVRPIALPKIVFVHSVNVGEPIKKPLSYKLIWAAGCSEYSAALQSFCWKQRCAFISGHTGVTVCDSRIVMCV